MVTERTIAYADCKSEIVGLLSLLRHAYEVHETILEIRPEDRALRGPIEIIGLRVRLDESRRRGLISQDKWDRLSSLTDEAYDLGKENKWVWDVTDKLIDVFVDMEELVIQKACECRR